MWCYRSRTKATVLVSVSSVTPRHWSTSTTMCSVINRKFHVSNRTGLFVGLALLLVVFGASCDASSNENDEQSEQFSKITETGTSFTTEDFLSIGFKQSKDYDVTELPGATSAIYGFWKPDGGESVDYEIRFYATHDDAVSKGSFFANEVTGPDAVVASKDVTWKEGTRDRRTSPSPNHGMGGSIVAKYADYVINSNVIILCQGLDKDQSLGRCRAMVNAVIENSD